MVLNFLRRADYLRSIVDAELEELLSADGVSLAALEVAAAEEIKGYLGVRYNLSNELKPLKPFVLGGTYAVGDRVVVRALYDGQEDREYLLGDVVLWRGRIYEALVEDATLEDVSDVNTWVERALDESVYQVVGAVNDADWPWLDGDNWLKGDVRNPLLVGDLVDIVLYHLFARVAPRQLNELRVKRYDDCLRKLKAVANGTFSYSLPLLREDLVPFGVRGLSSDRKQNWFF